MLKEFYDFIAQSINCFFQTSASDRVLLKGESFCLKLDDEEMVDRVTRSLRDLTEKNNSIGYYNFPDDQNPVYETFTLKVQDDEIIIAAQIEGMTNDFLCATLRNAANRSKKPILMITANPIDSAKSGSRDMSASGMPFYYENIIDEIKKRVDDSSLLTVTERQVLHYELKRWDEDVFSDKKSLYEYKDLLVIINSGKIEDKHYAAFRLFPIDAKYGYQHHNIKQIKKDIEQNNRLFEKIDRGFRFGNLESELENYFEERFIAEIQKKQKDDPEGWSRHFRYSQLLDAMGKKKEKQNNPLNLENSDFSVYGELPLNTLDYDDKFFIRNEGNQTTKKRTKNIIIFNSDNYSRVHIKVACNAKIKNNNISYDDALLERDGLDIIFGFSRDGISFHKLGILDDENSIRYVLKVCIIELLPQYLISAVQRRFVIDYKKTKKNSRIKLIGIDQNLIFNINGHDKNVEKLMDNGEYSCSISSQLCLYTTEEELSNYGSGIKIDVNFAGLLVPFILFPDEKNSVEITGRNIFKEKLINKKSFEFNNGNSRILSDTQEYFAKSDLLRELKVESCVIDRKLLCGRVTHFYDLDDLNVEGIDLKISQELQHAYFSMLEGFMRYNTIPTLAYLGGELNDLVKVYLDAFSSSFEELTEGANLTVEQTDALLLGTISVGRDEKEILLTPFHPLNLMYQIALQQEKGIQHATDIVIDRLNSGNLLPYIQRNKKVYKVSDQMNSFEWKYYAPVENRKYRGNRKFVPKLVQEKIMEFSSHFRYIFDDINNRIIKINLINMGDCGDVFVGISQYYIQAINKNPDIDKLMRFEIHIYTNDRLGNVFSQIREYKTLKQYLASMRLSIEKGTSMNDLEGVLSKNIECYFHQDEGKEYTYSHITFYEMESEITSEQATMQDIETGISLGGIISGIPSSKYGYKYRTGFGTKYALDTDLSKMAAKCNALIQVDNTGNPYYKEMCISTQIDASAEEKMEHIYNSSNWVVFVDPKVDLEFFCEKEAKSNLLIIHYSDQYTTSSGYDAITVTHKSQQYELVIREFLENKGIKADLKDIHNIINLFNAVNGDWLLRLVSSKRDTTFGREKISIVAAIKFMLAFLKHSNIIWVPISLEEMLRISGGTGLSKKEGVLSAKNLGFETGPTSDDLLFVGLDHSTDDLKIYLYPVEVKTGNNDSSVIKKAFMQTSNTATGLERAFNPAEELSDTIQYKVNRNFLMQLLIISCKKMAVYHVDDTQDWNVILDKFRCSLLNEKYQISSRVQEVLGRGAVLSFRKGTSSRKTSFKEKYINFIEMSENDEFDLILDCVTDIYNDICNRTNDLVHFKDTNLGNLTGDLSKLSISSPEEIEHEESSNDELGEKLIDIEEKPSDPFEEKTEVNVAATLEKQSDTNNEDNIDEEINTATKGMNILFGVNQQDNRPVLWNPNDTSQLFHTNTGIIGTMGTGKTQFTKSLVTQLYREKYNNIDGKELGILIFDYKGDYNESKEDFIQATDAKVLKPYHLPFNPLALTRSKVFKPLLPIHTANAFKDTISKVYGLGAKQQNILFQCIIETYESSGILPGDPSTWDNEAPTFDQVYQRYVNDDGIKKNDSLAAAMDKLQQFQIFENIPNQTKGLFDILRGVVVMDLSGYDSDIQSLIVAITLDLFYAQMQATGSSKMEGQYRQLTKLILVDEADNFMCEGFPALKKILKEGREFGVGTILSTQFLKHFGTGDDDYAKYILTWIVHNVADLKGSDVDFVFKTEPKSGDSQRLFNDIKSLTIHHSIVKIGTAQPVYVRDKAFWELCKELT